MLDIDQLSQIATQTPMHILLAMCWLELRALKTTLLDHIIRMDERSKNA